MPCYFGNQKVNPNGFGKIYVGSKLVYQKKISEPDYLCFTALESGNIKFTKDSGLTETRIIQYRLNNEDEFIL